MKKSKLRLTANAIRKLDKIMETYNNEKIILMKNILRKLIHNKNNTLEITTDAFQYYDTISGDWYFHITNKGINIDDVLPLLTLHKNRLRNLVKEEKKVLMEKINLIDEYLKEQKEFSESFNMNFSDNIIVQEKEDTSKEKTIYLMKKMYNFLVGKEHFNMKEDTYNKKRINDYTFSFGENKELKDASDFLDFIEYSGFSPMFGNINDISVLLEDETKFDSEFLESYLGENSKIYLVGPVVDSKKSLENESESLGKILDDKDITEEQKKLFLPDLLENKENQKELNEQKQNFLLKDDENVYYYISKNDNLETLENICLDATSKKYLLDKKDYQVLNKKRVYIDIKYMNYKKDRM